MDKKAKAKSASKAKSKAKAKAKSREALALDAAALPELGFVSWADVPADVINAADQRQLVEAHMLEDVDAFEMDAFHDATEDGDKVIDDGEDIDDGEGIDDIDEDGIVVDEGGGSAAAVIDTLFGWHAKLIEQIASTLGVIRSITLLPET